MVLKKGDEIVAHGDAATKDILERILKWTDDAGNFNWPPNNGFRGIINNINIPKGTRIDRYGSPRGKFTAPAGTPRVQRALAPGSSLDLRTYEVLKSLPAKSGEVAPWFDEVGGGIQHQFDKSIQELINEGFLKEVF